MRSKIATCLWLDGVAEEAARFYVSLVPGSELGPILRKEDGSALVVELSLGGTPYQLLDGGPSFELDEAASIVVHTTSQAETDRYWDALTSGGGRESRCGWCEDRFGVSWQVVPESLYAFLSSSDRAAAARAMEAMLKMSKIDMAAIESAFRGDRR